MTASAGSEKPAAKLSPEVRARLRELAAAATEGPWKSHVASALHEDAAAWVGAPGASTSGVFVASVSNHVDGLNDSAFIAAARQGVPALLDALDQAEARAEAMEEQDERNLAEMEAMATQLDRAEAFAFASGLEQVRRRCVSAVARAQRAEAHLAAVRALHKPVDDQRNAWCKHCGRIWPCPTAAALGSSEGDTDA